MSLESVKRNVNYRRNTRNLAIAATISAAFAIGLVILLSAHALPGTIFKIPSSALLYSGIGASGLTSVGCLVAPSIINRNMNRKEFSYFHQLIEDATLLEFEALKSDIEASRLLSKKQKNRLIENLYQKFPQDEPAIESLGKVITLKYTDEYIHDYLKRYGIAINALTVDQFRAGLRYIPKTSVIDDKKADLSESSGSPRIIRDPLVGVVVKERIGLAEPHEGENLNRNMGSSSISSDSDIDSTEGFPVFSELAEEPDAVGLSADEDDEGYRPLV